MREKLQNQKRKMPEQMTYRKKNYRKETPKSMQVISQVNLKCHGQQLGRTRRRTHQFSKDDPKCAETHVKDTKSSVKNEESPEAFSVSSETATRDPIIPRVDVEVMIKEILGENMVEIHGRNRNKSSEEKPNVFAHVDADLGRFNQAVKAGNDSEETGF